MNILFVVPYPPSRVRVRPYQLIRALHARGNQVTVLTVWSSAAEQADVRALVEAGITVQAFPLPTWRSLLSCGLALPGREPLQAAYCWQPALAAELARRAAAADVVHIEHLRGARFGLALIRQLERSGQKRVPVVWDSVDSISLLFRKAAGQSRSLKSRLMTRLELERTEQMESRLVHAFDRVVVTAPADRQALLELSRAKPEQVQVLPNGVDLDYFTPDAQTERSPVELVLSGKMSYHANVTMALNFVNQTLPLIWQERPDVRVTIVGKDPPKTVTALAADERITVTGTVADLRPYLRRAALAVAPIAYGVGIQNKVLEAMACATPVVTTPQAVSALQAQPGRDLIVAADEGALARAVVDLLADPARRAQVGTAGRDYVEQYHRWDRIAADLEEVYYEVMGAKHHRVDPVAVHAGLEEGR